MGACKSLSLVTFRCIFVMEFCDAGALVTFPSAKAPGTEVGFILNALNAHKMSPPHVYGAPGYTDMKQSDMSAQARAGMSSWVGTTQRDDMMTGTLWAALQRGMYRGEGGAPKLHAILSTASEVCEGVAYMHSHRVVHRDLTSGNILLKHEPLAQRVRAKVGGTLCFLSSLA